MTNRIAFVSTLTFLLSVFSTRLLGQTAYGSITGSALDSSGAPVSAVSVTLTSLETGAKRSITTGTDGGYQFVNVGTGNYKLEAEKQGFKHFVRQPVDVEVQNSLKIDITLQVGELSQQVEVTAQTPLLQPETSSLGQVVEQRKVNELPLNGRNPLNLVALVPSVVPQGGSMQNPNGTNPFAWGNYQIGGGMANQSSMLLDGSPLYISSGQLALVPTQDSLQEFKVQTNNLPAEFDRFAGGVINMTTKGGTNELHGSAWEFLRNRDLNANDFFDNMAGVPRPSFTQNQFGVNLGGPVYIPHVYNGHDKTFFFVDYEGFRLRQGQSFTETVPTLAERGGDFSNLRDASGNPVPIYDPLTTTSAANGQYSRTQFPGNVLPVTRLNPASLQLLRLYPLPNTTGNAFTGVNNYVSNASVGGNNNQTVARIDQNVSDKQHIFARYSYWGNLNLPIDPFKTGVCQDRCTEQFNTNNFVLDDVYSLNSTTVLDLRASYLRFSYNRTPETLGFDLSQLGWPSSLNSQVAYNPVPTPCISGFDPANVFCSNGTGSTIVDRNENYDVIGSLTKILGAHTIKAGGEFLRTVENYVQSNNPTGSFNFDQNFTSSNPLNPVGGSGLASFLLGYPSSGGADTPSPLAGQQLNWGAYVQDDWKVSKSLTVNLGLRWNAILPWTERHNRESFFEPNVLNPVLQQAGIANYGALGLVASAERSSRYNINPDYKQFAPRVGLAYQVTPKTVLRAGYGISWLPPNLAGTYSTPDDFLGSFSTPYVASINNGITPYGNFSNPFQQGIIQPPGRNPIYQQQALGQGISATALNNPYGYAQQWNFDVQQELGEGFMLDVAYAGSKGTHLPFSGQQINQLPDQYLSLGSQLLQQVPNPYAGIVQQGSLAASTVTRGQLLLPYPQYTGVSLIGSNVGDSSYESLQVKAEKRFTNGASLLVAYTHSKLISNTDALTSWLEPGGTGGVQNWNNLHAERSLTSFDVPDRLVVSYVLDLPFGKGRKFLSNASGFSNALIGGWGVEGVTTVQSGFPLHITTSQNLTNSYGGGSRPNVLGNASLSGSAQSRLNGWFNINDFAQPAAFTFGDESRNDPNLRAAGIANWDFSTFKNFPFGPDGKLNLQFRAEFFNIFNRVQFGAPGQTFGTPQFGVVSTQQNLPRLVQFALRFAF
ncbi:MAG TPA: TonB-dependent receptor [Bryobacteraceae bacterium]|nr:TonB-dependent receptor [Bryobacteraceae bacterium]